MDQAKKYRFKESRLQPNFRSNRPENQSRCRVSDHNGPSFLEGPQGRFCELGMIQIVRLEPFYSKLLDNLPVKVVTTRQDIARKVVVEVIDEFVTCCIPFIVRVLLHLGH